MKFKQIGITHNTLWQMSTVKIWDLLLKMSKHILDGKQTRLAYITLHYITLHYITLHYITLHYITLHYITLHYITLHYITLHYITLHYNFAHPSISRCHCWVPWPIKKYKAKHFIESAPPLPCHWIRKRCVWGLKATKKKGSNKLRTKKKLGVPIFFFSLEVGKNIWETKGGGVKISKQVIAKIFVSCSERWHNKSNQQFLGDKLESLIDEPQ